MEPEHLDAVAAFIRRKNELEERVVSLEEEVEALRAEVKSAKTAGRLGAVVTMLQWGKEAIVDFMRAPM